MEGLWGEFPGVLLEVVVGFLPLASLCRFRCVSKDWNRRLSNPNFTSWYIGASIAEDYVLFKEEVIEHLFANDGWEVLDGAGNKFINLENDFLFKFLEQEQVFVNFPVACSRSSHRRSILASDRGLICLSLSISHGSQSCCELESMELLLVCNPVCRSMKRLPAAGWVERPTWVSMAVESGVSMDYEIYFITVAEDASKANTIYIYQSKTDSWNASEGHLDTLSSREMSCSTSTVLSNDFYGLFLQQDRLTAGLVSFNRRTGTVYDLGIKFSSGGKVDNMVELQLVVCGERLFCVILHVDGTDPVSPKRLIRILEVVISRRECLNLSVLEGDKVDWLLGYIDKASDSEWSLDMKTIGYEHRILLCSYAGRSCVYDLSKRMWQKYANCRSSYRGSRHFLKLLASENCLSLCPP